MASTSYANNSNINYVFDVFLNHRGPDCKKTLAKHLYQRLTKEGLRVFLDVDELQAGENITPQIESAIRTALVHIAIFTPGYADSNWCLNELLLMFESGSTIIPVFYGVKPSDLRWGTQGEKGVYGQALQRLEKKETIDSQPRYDSNTIQKWRKALSDVAEIKGFDIETCNGDEQQLLQQVVEGVLKKVQRPVHVCRYPTGLDEKVEEFERAVSLEQQNRETKVIGIVGLGGVGKTTVAKQMFNRRRSNYKKSFFLFDVRETAARNSLIWLQSKILEGLGQSNVQIDSTDDGIEKLNRYLSSCHAFLILDDVDKGEQLEALLLPLKDVLHQGRLILVTSRNKDVLTSSGIVESSIFKLRELDPDHSRQLFCWHAFKQPYPVIEFEQVVQKFVDACNGLPLALKVLGALLLQKDLKYATTLFRKLSKTPHKDIRSKLKISYDDLDEEEKQTFLDIVCFFIGEDSDTVIRILDGMEGEGWLALHNLERRCLVEIDDRNCIRMHDQLRKLGRHIAQHEPPDWTLRLSCPTHDLRHLSDKSLVRGVSTVHSPGCESSHALFASLVELAGNRFTDHVRRLQLLRAEGYFVESILMERIFSVAMSLKWLCWVDFPYSSIPSWISLKDLRVLRIETRNVELGGALWLHGSQAPKQLRELSIRVMKASHLITIPKSIGKLHSLEKIVVVGNILNLGLPDQLYHLPSLKHLELVTSYSELVPIAPFFRPRLLSYVKRGPSYDVMDGLPDSFGKLINLEKLLLIGWSLEVLPDSFGNLTNLRQISLRLCSDLRMLPDSFGNLRNLQHIGLASCKSMRMLPDSFGNLTNLRYIDLGWCKRLEMLPDSFGNLMNLEILLLYRCHALELLPDSFGNLTNLRSLDLHGCSSLQRLPDSFGNLTNLRHIDLEGCWRLQMLPDSCGNLIQKEFARWTEMRDFFLTNVQTVFVPDPMDALRKLRNMNIS